MKKALPRIFVRVGSVYLLEPFILMVMILAYKSRLIKQQMR